MKRLLLDSSMTSSGAQPWTVHRNNRSGVVLVVVLVIVVLVAFAGFGFVASMSTEYEAVKLDAGRLQSDQALASAETLMQWYVDHLRLPGDPMLSAEPALMFRDVRLNTVAGDGAAAFDAVLQTAAMSPQNLMGEPALETDNSWRFTVLSEVTAGAGHRHSAGLQELREASDGAAPVEIQFGPACESGRLNLGLLLEFDAAYPGSGRQSLMRLTGMSPDAADSLLDWIDADDVRREFGAEAVDYQRQSLLCRPRNGLPETVAELLFVRGITRIALFGHDTNRNFRFDRVEHAARETAERNGLLDSERTADTRSGGPADELPSGWSSLITIYSVERNIDPDGRPRIDLNTDDLEHLHRSLLDIVPRELADFVILMRQYGPVESSANDVPVSLASVDLSDAASFSISAVSELFGSTGAVNSRSESVQAASPMDPATQAGRRLLQTLLSRTSMTAEPLIRGRLNINTAGKRVLQSVPGLSDSAVDRLIAHRETLDPESRLTTAWLIAEDILTVETYRTLQPWLTTRGDAFRCQILAFRPRGGPSKRVELVTGPTVTGSQRFFWRDLTGSGMGFPVSVYCPTALEQSERSAAGFQQ